MAQSEDSFLASKASYILNAQAPLPELRDGFSDISLLEKHKEVIQIILQDLFSSVLTNNEIKTASTPYTNIIFNSSKRFEKILEAAGPNYVPEIRNQEEEVSYIMACVVILNFFYGFNLDFKRPFFYDIPDAKGVMKHYLILYNADFIEILPNSELYITTNIENKSYKHILRYHRHLELESQMKDSYISKLCEAVIDNTNQAVWKLDVEKYLARTK